VVVATEEEPTVLTMLVNPVVAEIVELVALGKMDILTPVAVAGLLTKVVMVLRELLAVLAL
jgi:hypothetical protein